MENEIKIKVLDVVSVPEGQHTGSITDVVRRDSPQGYKYIDIYIKPDNLEMERGIKYGAPAHLSKNSKLGHLLLSLGCPLIPGEELGLKERLVGKEISFIIMNEETPRGTFARIVDDSIKLRNDILPVM